MTAAFEETTTHSVHTNNNSKTPNWGSLVYTQGHHVYSICLVHFSEFRSASTSTKATALSGSNALPLCKHQHLKFPAHSFFLCFPLLRNPGRGFQFIQSPRSSLPKPKTLWNWVSSFDLFLAFYGDSFLPLLFLASLHTKAIFLFLFQFS